METFSPSNLARRDELRTSDENNWRTVAIISLLARLAALFHDFGKANDFFQPKLTSKIFLADAYRHEWVSLRLFESFVRSCGTDDQAWLRRLANLSADVGAECLSRLLSDGAALKRIPPFKKLPPLAQIVGWLIVSHHRLPTPMPETDLKQGVLAKMPDAIEVGWCGSRPTEASAKACWQFKKGLLFASVHWCQHVAKTAQAVLQHPDLSDPAAAQRLLDNPFVLHLSRLALILADHYYSSLPGRGWYGDKPGRKGPVLFANSELKNGKRQTKQRLDEHSIGVTVSTGRIVRALPYLTKVLPPLAPRPAFLEPSHDAFVWQNQVFALAESLRERAARQGFFGVNMASTGCGKTLANGRIFYALADPQRGARFTAALGLRTLTLQTGDAYRNRLHLGDEDLAVLVGGLAPQALHASAIADQPPDQGIEENQEQARQRNGSESSAPLLPESNHVRYGGSLDRGPFKRWLGQDSKVSRLLKAPVLVCTIDHLMPATETLRGGHQIAPMLRLLTADLILDEPDDFGIEDLPALARLVHWAGLFGSRVLLSSATLPPALVQGLFLAYLDGRSHYQRNQGRPDEPLVVCCAWFDEFNGQAGAHSDGASYLEAHRQFIDQRLLRLKQAEVRRRAIIQPVPIGLGQTREVIYREWAGQLRQHLHELHRQHHSLDPQTGKRVSFGLIRMANIDPLFDVARELFRQGAKAGCRIHLCVYHSRHPLLVRAAIERELDGALQRGQAEAVFQRASVRQRLDTSPEADHIFVVLATAVAEVGRDHDYDWAIVEPSSMRSFIQLAGRVRRHRTGSCSEDSPNIYLLDTNIRHLAGNNDGLAFIRPGFESGDHFKLNCHHLTKLLEPEQWKVLDAAARIKEREVLRQNDNLVDLEHARLKDLLLGAAPGEIQDQTPVHHWWTTRAHLSGYLQQRAPFRHDPQGRSVYALLPNEDERIDFYYLPEGYVPRDRTLPASNHLWKLIEDSDLPKGPGIDAWATPPYLAELRALAEKEGKELRECAELYGTVDLPGRKADRIWRYHWALGFRRGP